jgi:hypothetical protein
MVGGIAGVLSLGAGEEIKQASWGIRAHEF